MKPLNEKLQKGVRAIVFALVATASIGTAIAMKPAALNAATYKYGVSDNGGQNWRVEAQLSSTAIYDCIPHPTSTCTVTYESAQPLAPNALIPKNQAQNPESGEFSMP